MPLLSSNPTQQCRWRTFNTTAELEQATTQAILQTALLAISLRGAFHIVLAGGTTPRHVYESLRNADADWAAWHIYFGDERCLPADHVERNSWMAAQAWLNHVAIPRTQIHFIPTEEGARAAASAYTQTLADIELFDLVLLGLGEDGHTASLFPGHELANTTDAPAVIVVENAPKYPPQRISLSAHRLSMAHKVIFIVSGAMKQQAVENWRDGIAIPAAAVSPTNGVDIYLEAALLAHTR
ncbi:6-phosphogluconolactonase [Candidatus Nitrotoga sp. HW29]|uniref:6-phosphogluconolactonase n=1 Tax=Candidatus Nitrotoga sp. HW29 TaxID=2886963 RepID=UPI001EF3117F|nr:6-phosphogluconolactonase [Candidatus Nitrotoga sp. HW29]CAH1905907.1 6-phosphogluconolactonase [Candidatus Nitrotoga sp. HW29]